MNKILTDRVSNFNNRIENLSIKEAVLLAKKEVLVLLDEYSKRTVRTYLTVYRNNLISDNIKVFNALSIPNKVQKSIKKEDNKRISKANKKGKEIKDIDKMIVKAIDLLDSNDVGELTAALCLMTGRRMTEILKTAKFTNSKNSKKVMYFRGQLKTDNKKMKYEIYSIENTRDLCKAALRKLRSIVDTSKMTNYEVSRKYENVVNSACRRLFSRNVGKADIDHCTAHVLRNIYALYCLENYKVDKWQTPNSFLSQILGHEEDDVITANSYQKYYLK